MPERVEDVLDQLEVSSSPSKLAAMLVVEAVGLINSTHPPKLVCDSFKIENGVKIATVSAPTTTRVLVTRGLKRTTRLGGV